MLNDARNPWKSESCYARRDDDVVVIGNDFVERRISVADGAFGTTAITNKLTDTVWDLRGSTDLRLIFARSAERIEIPYWHYRPGTPSAVEPDDDTGYQDKYYELTKVDENWRVVDRFTSVAESCGEDTDPVWPGYGWFHHNLFLPAEASVDPLFFNLGGYDNCDWNRYRLFVNGVEIGTYSHEGRWRRPIPIVVRPEDQSYTALHFGRENAVVVQTCGLDKMLPHMIPAEREHYFHASHLSDQFISIGDPYREVADFSVTRVAFGGDRARAWAKIVVTDIKEEIEALITLEVKAGDPLIRKTVEPKNNAQSRRLLLDACVDQFEISGSISDGGHGVPVLLDDEAFVAIEHPVGVNQGAGGSITLGHHPGVEMNFRQRVRLKTAIWGVSAVGSAKSAFHSYLKKYGKRRDEYVSIYDPLGYYDSCRPLNERLLFSEEVALDSVRRLEEIKERGVTFDYFVIDYGWADPYGDYKSFRRDAFPNGPQKLIGEVERLGMKFGLWFGVSYRPWTIGYNPDLQNCVVPRAGGPDDMCIAAEPYHTYFKDAVIHHIRHSSMRACKIDMARFHCNATNHGHLPGKYSVEAAMNACCDIAEAAYDECPDLFLMWYWQFSSPFWALFGSTIFDKRLNMEAAAVASTPNISYRRSTTLNLDQSFRYADLIPATVQDSLGIWIGNVGWANRMGSEEWRPAWLMDVLRGGMLNQLWGDFFLLDEEDEAFLAKWWHYFTKNAALLSACRPILGDPWKIEPYGYAGSEATRAIVAIHNPSKIVADVVLDLEQIASLRDADKTGSRAVDEIRPRNVILHQLYPSEGVLAGPVQLKPYEIKIIEITDATPEGVDVLSTDPPAETMTLHLESSNIDSNQSILLDGAKTPERVSHALSAAATLPDLSRQNALIIAVELSKSGSHSYSQEIAQRVTLQARLDGRSLPMTQVPSNPLITNGPGSPWTVFTCAVDSGCSGKHLEFTVLGLLPIGVDWAISAWVCQK